MKIVGTLLELAKAFPDKEFTHPKLQESVIVSLFEHHPNGIQATYYSSYGDGPPMIPYFGNQCPYENKGLVYYTANVTHMFSGSGGMQVLSHEFVNDDRWEVINGTI